MIVIIGKDITEKVKKHIKYLLIILTLLDIIFSSVYVYKRMNAKLWSDNKFINFAVVRELKEYQKLLEALTIDHEKNQTDKTTERVRAWTGIYKDKFHIIDIGILDGQNNNKEIFYNDFLYVGKITLGNSRNWGITEVSWNADSNRYVYAMWNKLGEKQGQEEMLYFVLPFENIQNILRAYYQEDESYSLIIQENRKIVAHSYKDEYLNSNAKKHGEKIIGYSQDEFEKRYNNGEIIPFLSYSKAKGVFYWNVYSWIENTNWLLLSRVNLNNYLLALLMLFALKISIFVWITKKIMKLLNKKIYKNTCCVDSMLIKSNKIICNNDSQENIDKLLKYSVGGMIDKQTGALRRDIFLSKVQEKIVNTKTQSYLFFIDMDNLKLINDSLGHNYGDLIINLFYKKIRNFFHKQDVLIGRFGGDEFLLYLHDLPKAELLVLLQDINANLRGRRKGIVYSASIGIAIYPEHSRDLKELLSLADQALYKAKEDGKGTYSIYKFVGK